MIAVKLNNLVGLKVAFDPIKVEKAYRSAIKKSAGKAKTQISKKVRQTYNIKARDINAITRVNNITQGVVITWIGSQLGLYKFTPLKRIITLPKGTPWGNKRTGVSVRIKKSNKRKLVKTGFQVAKLNNQIFERNGEKMKSDPTKDAIKKMSGISIPQMVNDNILNEAARFMEKETPIQFERAFNFFVGKK